MKQILTSLLLLFVACSLWAQNVTLTFTGKDTNSQYLPFDYVVVVNATQNWEEILYYPDTILTMGPSMGGEQVLTLYQNNPNPFDGTTYVTLKTVEDGEVVFSLSDMSGRIVSTLRSATLLPGVHQFRVQVAGVGIYVLTARQNGRTSSIKMVNKSRGSVNKIEYQNLLTTFRSAETEHTTPLDRSLKRNAYHPFNMGDEMIYTGYATINGVEQASQTIDQNQTTSEDFVLYFNMLGNNDGGPCLGTAIASDYDGNVYHTVRVGNQCWMKENLRTSHYADGTEIMLLENGSVLNQSCRYYPNGNSGNVSTYGYLYNWRATMHGAAASNLVPSGVQGVCPNGWHVPSSAEWERLLDYVNSRNEYRCDGGNVAIGKAMASTEGWNGSTDSCDVGYNPYFNNATGFSALPAGRRGFYSGNQYFGDRAIFWNTYDAGNYGFMYNSAGYCWFSTDEQDAYSVRCLRDETGINVITTAVTDVTRTTAVCGGKVVVTGNVPVTERGICWSTSQNPTIDDARTIDGSGPGSFTSTLTGLTEGTKYYLRAYATNSDSTTYGNLLYLITTSPNNDGQPCSGPDTITDYDGNVYHTVQIGRQCWMRENMRATHFSDSTEIALGGGSITTPNRFYPNNDSTKVDRFGYLYNGTAALHGALGSEYNPSGIQGVCPNGWHVPSDAEWTQLTEYVISQFYYLCGGYGDYYYDDFYNYYIPIGKSMAFPSEWMANTYPCTVGDAQYDNNATGFSAMPAGICSFGTPIEFRASAYFWTATTYQYDYNTHMYARIMSYDGLGVRRMDDYRGNGMSVRCLRDEVGTTVQTNAVLDVTQTTAVCRGNVVVVGDVTVSTRGMCWSTSQNPTLNDAHTIEEGGVGTFTSMLTGLTEGTTYYVRAYVTSADGTVYGNQRTLLTTVYNNDGQPCPGATTITDVDGNIYNTVLIGQQCWMKENLKTTRYADGITIPLVSAASSVSLPYRYYPNSDSANVSVYGYLYNWPAVMQGAASSNSIPSGVQGICPDGWHVPSNAEWMQLTDYVGSQFNYLAGGYLHDEPTIAKALADSMYWEIIPYSYAVGNDLSANNATGFSARPAGSIHAQSFDVFGGYADFWSTTPNSSGNYYILEVFSRGSAVNHSIYSPKCGFSVRCLRDQNN